MSNAYEKAIASGYSHHLRRMGWPEDELIAQTRRFIRAVKAQAWDEGFNASENNIMDTPNPYQEDT